MDIAAVIAELEAKREGIDQAISVLRAGKRGPGRPKNGRRHQRASVRKGLFPIDIVPNASLQTLRTLSPFLKTVRLRIMSVR